MAKPSLERIAFILVEGSSLSGIGFQKLSLGWLAWEVWDQGFPRPAGGPMPKVSFLPDWHLSPPCLFTHSRAHPKPRKAAGRLLAPFRCTLAQACFSAETCAQLLPSGSSTKGHSVLLLSLLESYSSCAPPDTPTPPAWLCFLTVLCFPIGLLTF